MRVRVGHVSLQYKDTDKQHTHDIKKIFDRAVERRYAWITGTESGPGSGNTNRELLRVGSAHGYRMWLPTFKSYGAVSRSDCWIAIREDLIRGDYTTGFRMAIPGSEELRDTFKIPKKRKWTPRGLLTAKFESLPELGTISIGAAHYLTDGRNPGDKFYNLNRQLARKIGEWAEEEGAGTNLVFYGGDQNKLDNRNNEKQGDTFYGEDMTSVWDELGYWNNTGHGPIDVIASSNKDKRVRAMRAHAYNDKEFHLYGDHFLVEATFDIDPIKKR